MTRTVRGVDRVLTALVGLVLIAAALIVLDAKYQVVSGAPTSLSTGPVSGWTVTGWWPWAVGAAGVVLVLLGLWWLLSHARHTGDSTRALDGSDATGRLQVDLSSVASAAGKAFESSAPVTGVRASTPQLGRQQMIVLTGHVEPRAHGESLVGAARAVRSDVQAAFGDDVEPRFVLDRPQRPRRLGPSTASPRVR